MTDNPHDLLEPDDDALVDLDHRARAAVGALQRATEHLQPPPLARRTSTVRVLQLVAGVVAVAVIAATATATLTSHQPATAGTEASVVLGPHQLIGLQIEPTSTSPAAGQRPSPKLTVAGLDTRAGQVMRLIVAGRYQQAAVPRSPNPGYRVNPLEVQIAWKRVLLAYGAVRHIGTPAPTFQTNPTVYWIAMTVTLTHGTIAATISLSPQGQFIGWLFSPGCTKACAPNSIPPTTASVEANAISAVHKLTAGDFRTVVESFEPLLRVQLNANNLETYWRSFERAYGSVRSVGRPSVRNPLLGPQTIIIPITWAHAHGHILVEYDPNTGYRQIFDIIILRPDLPLSALEGQAIPYTRTDANTAIAVVGDLQAGNYHAISRRFNALAAANITTTQLQHDWQTLTARLGPIAHIATPAYLAGDPNSVSLLVPITFTNSIKTIQVDIDNQDRLQSIVIQP